MPIRIYALAKELKIENKELVEVCNKAGITGKGSALASLTDEETDRVKSFLQGASSKPVAKKTAAPAAKKEAEAPGVMTRDQYIAPAISSKVKVLGGTKSKSTGEKNGDDKVSKPSVKKPVVNLAPMPEAKQPSPKAKSDEPKAQKPDILLPKDAISGHKRGKPAPLGQFTKTEKKSTPAGGKKMPAQRLPKGGEPPATEKSTGRGTRRGKTGERGRESVDAGMAATRASRSKVRKSRNVRNRGDDDRTPYRRSRRRLTRTRNVNTAAPRKENAVLELPCTVRSFSEAASISAGKVIMTLMGIGPTLTINQHIDDEFVELLTAELGVELEIKQQESLEDSLITQVGQVEDAPELLLPRPPIVTFLGHVDHGKTSLLDKVIDIDVVSGEAGGITQHIRAYKIKKGDREIAFVDTPGHEAFTEMRARGANVTDIAVLVVAADDGIMPQTEEAISHAKAAEVPIVVAMNKMDLPGADTDKVMQQLAAVELLPSQWGGDIEVVPTSAMTGDGIDDLLETLLLTADIQQYKANPNRSAMGTCLEAEQEGRRGVIAKLIVQNGTMKVGDVVVCGSAYGRIKAMYDTLKPNVTVDEAGPSTPVNITGLDIAPEAGDAFYVLDNIAQAREIAEQRSDRSREQSLSGITTKVSFEEFQRRLEEGRLEDAAEVVTLNLIIRADVRGSIEAIQKELSKLQHPEVQVKILQASVGGVTAADVMLAYASQAVIVAFNVIPDEQARILAEEKQAEIRRYDIIYKVTDDIKAMLEGKLKPEERVIDLGRALVKQIFTISRVGTIAGCYVSHGAIERGCRIRVNREERTIGDYSLGTLRREKDDAKEVKRGVECGIKLDGFNDIKVGDILEAYKIEEVARTLES